MVQDSLLGCSNLTRRNTFVSRDLMMNLLMHVPGFDGRVPIPAIIRAPGTNGQPLWTGKQVMSLALPSRILNFAKYNQYKVDDEDSGPFPNQIMTPNDAFVYIEDGEILSGSIDSSAIKTAQGGLVLNTHTHTHTHRHTLYLHAYAYKHTHTHTHLLCIYNVYNVYNVYYIIYISIYMYICIYIYIHYVYYIYRFTCAGVCSGQQALVIC